MKLAHDNWLPCLSFFLSLAAVVAAKSKKPNFVVLFVDDLGYGDLGFTGHPTTKTPNLDHLAYHGKILTTWYSGCSVCSGSRTSLMTGRQFARTGMPGVLGAAEAIGLPLNETTLAEHLKKEGGYTTAIVGKWHLGQRQVYLPANRGFDYYLGIPYSDDMGNAYESSCPSDLLHRNENEETPFEANPFENSEKMYRAGGFLVAMTTKKATNDAPPDPAGDHLPLVYQDRSKNVTKVVEQPLDFSTLAQKYNDFTLDFLEKHQEDPFFLYMPFSHVHATAANMPGRQYAGCDFKGCTERGRFGDALAESDWIVGNVMQKLRDLKLEENTLVLFTSDNGPWLIRHLAGGSAGLFTGRFANYWDTAKGSTWEGGIRMPAFAYWKGKIPPFSRSSEIISSLDVFPTLSGLADLPLPPNRTIDGRDMSNVLLSEDGKSKHDFLFFYSTCSGGPYWNVSSVRHGDYKAHWCTKPGFAMNSTDRVQRYDPPLLFNVAKDPSEAEPLSYNGVPDDPEDAAALQRIQRAYAMEIATFEFGHIDPPPDQPGEGPGRYGVCCDRARDCNCKGDPAIGIFNLGTVAHHDRYHEVLGEEEPSPAATAEQRMLQQEKKSLR